MGGATALGLAAWHPGLPAAIVMLDAPVLLPEELVSALLPQHSSRRSARRPIGMRRGSSSQLRCSGRRDDPERKERILDGMSAAPQHVLASAFRGDRRVRRSASALQACKVPALFIGADPLLSDLGRMRELCPTLLTGQTVGSGHFHQLEVPEQVNAMIERFLAASVPRRKRCLYRMATRTDRSSDLSVCCAAHLTAPLSSRAVSGEMRPISGDG